MCTRLKAEAVFKHQKPSDVAAVAVALAAIAATTLSFNPPGAAAGPERRGDTVSAVGDHFVYRANPASKDEPGLHVRLYRNPDGGHEFVVGEPAGVTFSGNCTPADQVYICNTGPGTPTIDLIGHAGRADNIYLYIGPVPPNPYFSVPATVRTSTGSDTISLSGIAAKISAGRGPDLINIEANSSAPDAVASPGGEVHGGRGIDTLTYAEATSLTLRITLDDKANDGRPGELDNIHSDVENLIGPSTGFTAIGSNRRNVLIGGRGEDRLVGKGGRDALRGKKGDDLLNARDGKGGDVVTCGEGEDTVLLDRGDRMKDRGLCESVAYAD
jgi:Ca2+-binding RTX toxin-like protein